MASSSEDGRAGEPPDSESKHDSDRAADDKSSPSQGSVDRPDTQRLGELSRTPVDRLTDKTRSTLRSEKSGNEIDGSLDARKARTIEVTVMSRPVDVEDRTAGHIMIVIAVEGEGEVAYGFYSKGSIPPGASCVNNVCNELTIPGIKTYERASVIRINEKTYESLKNAINSWKDKSWALLVNDCTDFVTDVLTQAGITVPSDRAFPNVLGRDYEMRFGGSAPRCLGPGAPNSTSLRLRP